MSETTVRKLLYSPGFGAGWTTWASDEMGPFMATYQPLIDFIEGGGKFEQGEWEVRYEGDSPVRGNLHPLLWQFALECQEKFGEVPYLGGARDLAVYVARSGERVRFEEYDGNESVVTDGDEFQWL